jgi:hypothetical protein
VNAENIGEAADGAAADEMAVTVVNRFEAIKIEEQHGEGTAGPVGAFGLVFENVKEAAVISETGERIADGKMADLFEEAGVFKQRAAEGNRVAQDHKRLGENEGRVEETGGLGGRELGSNIQPGCRIDSTVEYGVFGRQAAAIPDETGEKDCAGKQLLWIGEEGAGMPGNIRWQAAECRSKDVGQDDDG